MVTYVLIHRAGSDSWYWHRVVPLLRERGHEVATMDLPCADEAAGLEDYADVVEEAIGAREGLVVVGQSLGGFVAPLVCARRDARLLLMLNAMIPRPGESDWWEATGYPLESRARRAARRAPRRAQPTHHALCANFVRVEGDERIRTAVRGFAGLCLTTRPRRPAAAS